MILSLSRVKTYLDEILLAFCMQPVSSFWSSKIVFKWAQSLSARWRNKENVWPSEKLLCKEVVEGH